VRFTFANNGRCAFVASLSLFKLSRFDGAPPGGEESWPDDSRLLIAAKSIFCERECGSMLLGICGDKLTFVGWLAETDCNVVLPVKLVDEALDAVDAKDCRALWRRSNALACERA